MQKLVVLSGAGISAESGIRTFRDSDGLWEEYRIEDVCTFDAWQRNPALVTDFYNQRRKQLLEVKPNYGHIGLAELEKCFDVQIITQNVDNLHERAGSKNILHLHGELTKVRSEKYDNLIYELPPEKYEVKIGDLCEKGFQLRPHIVWFGEAVPMIEKAAEWAYDADIFVIIGTSLNVYPAASLIRYVKRSAPVYIIDPNEVALNNPDWHYIRKGASEGVKELKQCLMLNDKFLMIND
ncbi:MAG: NAD-dependent deacylase [Prevotellaceae bacterium]|jgi:NAD-dependent deacetylase|nr:NAD-dependent deacylase [Prevotellaceae bacterium]